MILTQRVFQKRVSQSGFKNLHIKQAFEEMGTHLNCIFFWVADTVEIISNIIATRKEEAGEITRV